MSTSSRRPASHLRSSTFYVSTVRSTCQARRQVSTPSRARGQAPLILWVSAQIPIPMPASSQCAPGLPTTGPQGPPNQHSGPRGRQIPSPVAITQPLCPMRPHAKASHAQGRAHLQSLHRPSSRCRTPRPQLCCASLSSAHSVSISTQARAPTAPEPLRPSQPYPLRTYCVKAPLHVRNAHAQVHLRA